MPLDASSGEAVIDARELPPGSRHTAIFEAFEQLSPQQSLMLIVDHDPRPLQRAIALRYGDNFSVEYLSRGPEAWRMRYRKARSAQCCGGSCSG
jgi:uncharacterized protein (DUF2249 family)